MHTTGDQHLVKKINRSIVLDTIQAKSPISRAALSEATGLNKGTISSLVNELIEDQFVYEIGFGQSSGGRKPMMLLFQREAGYAVGVDIHETHLLVDVIDLDGQIQSKHRIPLPTTDATAVTAAIVQTIQSLQAELPSRPYGIVGIGIAVPGTVNRQGRVLLSRELDWQDVPLQEWLQAELQTDVIVDNEANAGARGAIKDAGIPVQHDVLYLSIGSGIGAGIIVGGTLLQGMAGYAGEAGHMTVERDGKQCRCGNRGCWEQYASLSALMNEAAPLGYTSFSQLLGQAVQDDLQAQQLLANTGTQLGVGIAALINVLNPNLVLIGGELAQAKQWMHASLLESVRRRSLPFCLETAVQYATSAAYSAVRGAAWQAIWSFFDKERVILP